MKTIMKNNKTGEEQIYLTQQYDIGLYLIVNNNPANQFNIHDVTEKQFHKDLENGKLLDKDWIKVN